MRGRRGLGDLMINGWWSMVVSECLKVLVRENKNKARRKRKRKT